MIQKEDKEILLSTLSDNIANIIRGHLAKEYHFNFDIDAMIGVTLPNENVLLLKIEKHVDISEVEDIEEIEDSSIEDVDLKLEVMDEEDNGYLFEMVTPNSNKPKKTVFSALLQSNMDMTSVAQPLPGATCSRSDDVKEAVKKKILQNKGTFKSPLKKKEISQSQVQQNKTHQKYTCETCGKSWPSKAHLTMHVRIHTGEKPFECKICSSKFATRGNLEGHILRKHPEAKLYQCTLCGCRFSTRKQLKEHDRQCRRKINS